jgi:hypothetical protein
MNSVAGLWRGQLPLRRAFWTWLVGVGLLVNSGCTAAAMALVAIAPDTGAWTALAAVALHLAAVPLNLVCVAGVWRSSARADAEVWRVPARVAAVAIFLVYVVL